MKKDILEELIKLVNMKEVINIYYNGDIYEKITSFYCISS